MVRITNLLLGILLVGIGLGFDAAAQETPVDAQAVAKPAEAAPATTDAVAAAETAADDAVAAGGLLTTLVDQIKAAAEEVAKIKAAISRPKAPLLPELVQKKRNIDQALKDAQLHHKTVAKAEAEARKQIASLEKELKTKQAEAALAAKNGVNQETLTRLGQDAARLLVALGKASGHGQKARRSLDAAIEAVKLVRKFAEEAEDVLTALKKFVDDENSAASVATAPVNNDAAAPAAEPPRIFSIIIGLANDIDSNNQGIGNGVRVSAEDLLRELKVSIGNDGDYRSRTATVGLMSVPRLQNLLPSQNTAMVSNLDIKGAIERLLGKNGEFRPDDTIFCYVMAHGGYDVDLKNRPEWEYGHYFQWNNGNFGSREAFARCDLFELLLDQREAVGGSRKSGLTVLISESCNTFAGRLGNKPTLAMESAAPVDTTQARHLYRLLTEFEGQVSINGTSRDELGWYRSTTGGFYSHAFVKLLANNPDEDWPTYFVRVADSVQAEYDANPPMGSIARRKAEVKKHKGAIDSMTPMWMRSPGSVKRR